MENKKEKLLRLMNEYPSYEVKFVVGEELCFDYPSSICGITDVTVEKLREISNVEQFVEIENYYKNKILTKENESNVK